LKFLWEMANYLLQTLKDKIPEKCLKMYLIKNLFSYLKKKYIRKIW
jgi:hypothetical protein